MEGIAEESTKVCSKGLFLSAVVPRTSSKYTVEYEERQKKTHRNGGFICLWELPSLKLKMVGRGSGLFMKY